MQVLIAADELAELLDDQPLPDPLPRGLWVVDALGAALDVTDAIIHQRMPRAVASRRLDGARRHGLDSDEAAASGFYEADQRWWCWWRLCRAGGIFARVAGCWLRRWCRGGL